MVTLEPSYILPDNNTNWSDKTKTDITPSHRLKPSPQTHITSDALVAPYLSQESKTGRKAHANPTTLDNLG